MLGFVGFLLERLTVRVTKTVRLEENKATQLELQVVMNTFAEVKTENQQLKEKVDEMEQHMRSKYV